jgi:hypothetical protein
MSRWRFRCELIGLEVCPLVLSFFILKTVRLQIGDFDIYAGISTGIVQYVLASLVNGLISEGVSILPSLSVPPRHAPEAAPRPHVKQIVQNFLIF